MFRYSIINNYINMQALLELKRKSRENSPTREE